MTAKRSAGRPGPQRAETERGLKLSQADRSVNVLRDGTARAPMLRATPSYESATYVSAAQLESYSLRSARIALTGSSAFRRTS